MTQPSQDYGKLLQSLGLHPQSIKRDLLQQALTHSSVMSEKKRLNDAHNERLEFLGDAFLKVSLSQWLYDYLDLNEGEMTAVRSYVVSNKALAKVGRQVGLEEYAIVGKGLQSNIKDSMLANILESLFGAISISLDFDSATRTILNLMQHELQLALEGKAGNNENYKKRLQEYTQSAFKSLPVYTDLPKTTPVHVPEFEVEVSVANRFTGVGKGSSKQAAGHDAARKALEALQVKTSKTLEMSEAARNFFDFSPADLPQPQNLYLAPSVLSADFGCLREALEQIRIGGAPWVHLDVMDGHFVPNLTIGPPVIKALRKYSNQVFDAHLMMDNPQDYLEDFAKAGCDRVTVHYEASDDPLTLLKKIKDLGMLPGITVKPGTDVQVLEPLVKHVSLVLVMSVEPGFGGQKFMPVALDKIATLHQWRTQQKLDFLIQVDGGIDENTLPGVIEAGANVVVIGSSVFKTPDPVHTMRQFNQQLCKLES